MFNNSGISAILAAIAERNTTQQPLAACFTFVYFCLSKKEGRIKYETGGEVQAERMHQSPLNTRFNKNWKNSRPSRMQPDNSAMCFPMWLVTS